MNENLVVLAHSIAETAHTGQIDKAGVAYIEHPRAVAALVELPEEKAVAYLHDAIEDSDVTAADLLDRGMSADVVEAVVAMTKVAGENYEGYLDRVKRNKIARVVKLADLTHNSQIDRLSSPSAADFARIEKYRGPIAYLR